MNSRLFIGLLVIFVYSIVASSAYAEDFPKRLCEQGNIPGGTVRTIMLSSGIKAFIQHVPRSEAAGISLSVKAGSELDTQGSWGRAHFLEHLLFRRTARFSGGKLSVSLDSIGADRGASTTENSLNFWEVVPNGSAELALQIEADRLSGLVFTPRELELERRLLIKEVAKLRANPWRLVRQHLLSSLYPHLRNGELVPDGAASDIASITAQELIDFYKRYFIPGRTCIYFITSEPFSLSETRLERHFGKNLIKNRQNWEKQAVILEQNNKNRKTSEAVVPASSQDLLSKKETDLCTSKSRQGMAVFAWPAPKLSTSDYADWLVLNILWADSSEAYLQKVIQEHGLTSKVKINYDADFGDSMYVIGAHCTAGISPQKVADLLEEALSNPDSQKFVALHLEAAKRRAVAHFYKLWQNYQDRLCLFEDLNSEHPESQLISVPEAIKAVNTDSVLALWNRLARSHPQTYISESTEFWKSFSASPGPRRVFVSSEEGSDKVASATVPKNENDNTNSPVKLFYLDNGVKVQVWIDNSLPIASMRAFLDCGEISQDKLIKAAAELMGRNSIIQNGESVSLQEVVEREGFTLNFVPQQRGISINGWCCSDQLPRLLNLLGAVLKNPQFSTSDVDKILQKYNKEDSGAAESGRLKSLTAIIKAVSGSTLNNKDLEIQKISASELQESITELIHSASISLNFSGCVKTEEIKKICQEELGEESAFRAAENVYGTIRAEQSLIRTKGSNLTVEGKFSPSVLLVGQVAPPPGHRDYFAYMTALQILGGSSSSRLPLRIVHLEKLGSRASVSDMSTVCGRPSWVAVFQVQEDKQDRALAILRQELQRLLHGTSQTELDRALSACKGRLQISWSSPDGKAEWLRLQGPSASLPEEHLRGYSKVSLSDIKRVASVWLNSKNLIIVRTLNSASERPHGASNQVAVP
ncbi:MAG: M16 family metallopeptidase [Candidatus Bruticola sp.]